MIEVRLSPEEYKELLDKLDDLTPLLQDIGELLVDQSVTAFKTQSWDGKAWPSLYAGAKGPFINVAGALADLNSGPNVSQKRFKDKPALMNTGALFKSMNRKNLRYGADNVRLVPDVSYYAIHNEGGRSTQKVSKSTKSNLKIFLGNNPKFKDRLGFLFNVDVLVTNVHKRQFLGMTKTTTDRIKTLVEDYITGEK